MTIRKVVSALDKYIPKPTEGLPKEVFYFISRVTPLVNVDILIKDDKGRTLLAWRDDKYCGTGWHVIGGIVRYKETLEDRLTKTALAEVGPNLKLDLKPLTITQIFVPKRRNRSHFISFLYGATVTDGFILDNKGRKPGEVGFLKWHKKCPKNLLACQEMYRRYIDETL